MTMSPAEERELEIRATIAAAFGDPKDAGTVVPSAHRKAARIARDFRVNPELEHVAALRDAADPRWDTLPHSLQLSVITYVEERDTATSVHEHGVEGHFARRHARDFTVDEDLEFILSLRTADPARWALIAPSDKGRAERYAADKADAKKYAQ